MSKPIVYAVLVFLAVWIVGAILLGTVMSAGAGGSGAGAGVIAAIVGIVAAVYVFRRTSRA